MKNRQKIVLLAAMMGLAVSCRKDPPPAAPSIDKIAFEESAKTIFIGDTVTVKINAEPNEAKKYNAISYKASENGIIEIKESSGNDGVVFAGIKRGSTVITASVNGNVDYCNVTVLGGSENVIPHIIVPYYVMECRPNERRSIVASLAGGTPVDNSGFVWSYTNQKVISMETTGNIGVYDALDIGETIVTISHPKAQFSVNILIYVAGNDEVPVYITSDSNVINLKTTDTNYQYAAELRGLDNSDYQGFVHEVLDGKNIIDINYHNNIGTITPKGKGTARIGISHPKAAHRLEIVVIVSEDIIYRYIDVDKTLVITEEGSSALVKALLTGEAPHDYIDKFSFEIENNGVMSVQQSYDYFSIQGLKKGKSVLTIKNEYADFPREVLVIVNGEGEIYDNEVYISTSQNVITTEAGGDDVLLNMTLVGGNEADKNNFIWTVDDYTVIEVESGHGKTVYRNRSMTGNVNEKFDAQAIIKAKKEGTATITLENPKAKNSFSVIVKVYKKGTFGAVPVVLDGPGVYKVNVGGKLPAKLSVVTGNDRNLSNMEWTSENANIVSVNGSGLEGVLEGKNTGITEITVSGDNVRQKYSALVIVGDDDYFENTPYMYARNPVVSVIKGETISFRINCENMTLQDMAGINIINNSNDIIEVLGYRNSVTVTGLELGEGEIIISGDGLNTVKITVMVEDYNINPDMPYYLRSERAIYGVVKGSNIHIPVDLVGGSSVNEKNILWKIENNNIALINGNGRLCLVNGRSAGQTLITVSHPKSHNSLEIVLYVAETEQELDNKVVIYVKEQNMLLQMGEVRFISVITNANDVQKNGFQWDVSNYNVIDVSIGGDNLRALISAKSVGNAVISIKHNAQSIPAAVYVSVLDRTYNGAYINVPSIVEMTAGDLLSINAMTNNITDQNNIHWSIQDKEIAAVYGNGDSCLVNALKEGNTVITVKCDSEGFRKDILLYVYNSIAEMAGTYIIASEQSRYVINEGDIISVNLLFGMKGFPEHELPNINWSAGDNNVVSVTGNGKTAHVRGLNAGIGKVRVGSGIANTVEFEVEVVDNNTRPGQYWFNISTQDRIKGILIGEYADITVRVFNGNNEVLNINGIKYTVENNDIISIVENGDTIRVTASGNKEGKSFITLKHDLAGETNILIYTSFTAFGLEDMYPVLAEKTNYLIKKGESIDIKISTRDNNTEKINNITYGLELNNGVITLSEKNKREIAVRANAEGSDVILVRYNALTVQKIYVSVTEGKYGLAASYLATENIIGLIVGNEYETTINTNADYNVLWKTKNDYIVGIVDNSGKSAVIKGYNPGKTVLSVKAGDIERNIEVIVCETEAELGLIQAINIEQRYYRIQKHENININIHSYQGRVEGETKYSDYYNYDIPYGNVIQINSAENNRLSLRGINEGMAAIRVMNEFYNTEIVIYIEVSAVDSGKTGIIERRNYITAPKTLYVLDKNDRDVMISAGIHGDNFHGESYWIWSGYDTGIITVDSAGGSALVNPQKEGQTEIRVSNLECANTLIITVIVGDRFVAEGGLEPYIHVEKDVYEVSKNAGNISIPYGIVNVNDVDINNVRPIVYNDIIAVTHDLNSQLMNVAVYESGIARFEIVYGELRKEVYVLVKEDIASENIYLTTSENYVIVAVGELRPVNVSLTGYNEINDNNFTWDSGKSDVLTLAGNGKTGHIYGISEGTALITVSHPLANSYPLTINVKVVKDKTKEKVIYLTTQRNVIETIEGNVNDSIYIQKIGGTIGNDLCEWNVSDESILELRGHGHSAQFSAKRKGTARITALDKESGYKLEIVVIVKQGLNNGIYIGTDSNLIMMTPGEAQKKIKVSLVNGDEKNNNQFRWHIDLQTPADTILAGEKVISITGSNDECFINAVNEGTALIRVAHDKSDHDLIITVYVTQYREIQFTVKSKSIITGENEFVGINFPTYEYMSNKVKVWSDNIDVCDVYYTNEMVLLYGKSAGTAVISAAIDGKQGEAQLYVNVSKTIEANTNRIIVGKSLYVINPGSGTLSIDALISGPNIVDYDNDDILWVMNKTGIVDMFPSNTPVSSGTGRQVQIKPKSLGTVNILIKHDYVEEKYWKQVTIIVADPNNKFSVSRKEIVINNLTPEKVSVNIMGGTTKDYAEVKWTAQMQRKWDGTMLEVVRVIGSGKEITLYPMNDGHTQVFVSYGTAVEIIDVQVVSEYYFNFKNSNEYMYPGEQRDIPFEIRPTGSNVNWVNTTANSNEIPVVTFGEMLGSGTEGNNEALRALHIEAKREGTTQIAGMANGKIAQLNIVVQYDYSFNIAKTAFGKPKYNGSGVNYEGKTEIEYTVHPPDTYIKVLSTITGLDIDIHQPDIKTGKGKVIFTGNKEILETVEFQHYKARVDGKEDIKVEGDASLKKVQVMYSFGESIVPEPYFVRGDGVFSNEYNGRTAKKLWNGKSQGETIQALPGGGYEITIGDGEEHYLLFDKKYENAELQIEQRIDVNLQSGAAGNSKFKAEGLEYNVDGIKQMAVRLSGGEDYIDYNRVLFDKELFMYVKSAYVDNNDATPTKKINLYSDVHGIEYEIQVATFVGQAMSVYHPPRFANGNEADHSYFYLLKDEYIDKVTLIMSAAQFIKSHSWLDEYYNSNKYTYHLVPFTKGVDQLLLKKALSEYCDKVKVYKPAFTYPWQVFVANKDKLDKSGTNKSYLIFDEETGDIIGGHVSSYHELDGEIKYIPEKNYMAVYEYDQVEVDMAFDPDEGFMDGEFSPGRFNDSFIPALGNNYNEKRVYSTIAYSCDMPEYTEENAVESIFNVFGKYYINSHGVRVPEYGVRLMDAAVSPAYKPGALTASNDWGLVWEYVNYINIKKNYVYTPSGYPKGKNKPSMGIINGEVGKSTPLKVEAGTKSVQVGRGMWRDEKVYAYIPLGPNRSGANIFGDHFGSYGPDYFMSHHEDSWKWFIIKYDKRHISMYGPSRAQQKLEWRDTGKKVITPYYIFNRFPYRYEKVHPDTGVPNTNIVKISDGGGRPMPSISTTVKNRLPYVIIIRYKTFDFKDTSVSYQKTLQIRVNYEERGCHSMYKGSKTNDSFINYVNESGVVEYAGKVNDFGDGYFKSQAEIKKFLE